MKDNQEVFLSTSPLVIADFLEVEKLNSADLAFMKKIGTKRHFSKDDIIQSMGKRVERMFYVLKGKARGFLLSIDGIEKAVIYTTPGCFIGDEPFFHGQPSKYIAVATEDVEAIEIKHSYVSELVSRPNIAYVLLKSLSLKSRVLATQIEDLAFRSTVEKVARLLYCLLAESQAQKGKTKKVGITQQELATIAGAHRVSITNAISQLKKEGIIETQRDGSLLVKDWENLRLIGFGE